MTIQRWVYNNAGGLFALGGLAARVRFCKAGEAAQTPEYYCVESGGH